MDLGCVAHSTKTVCQHKMSTKKFSGLECLYARACEPSTISDNGGYEQGFPKRAPGGGLSR